MNIFGQFEEHTVGEAQHQELWIPAEEVEEFNKHIIRHLGIPYLGRSSAVYATRVAMQAKIAL